MTTVLTLVSLAIAAFRIKKGVFTRIEWCLLIVWLAHTCLEWLQLVVYTGTLCYSARFMRPAEFLVWGWTAWGLSRLTPRMRNILFLLLGLAVVYDAVLLFKAQLPVGRRSAYVSAAEWAAEKIRADWKGPANDKDLHWRMDEYRTAKRPVVDCHTARVAYLVDGRTNGIDKDDVTQMADQADYWIQDVRVDDPPSAGWELMETFKRGKYVLPLYRRMRETRSDAR